MKLTCVLPVTTCGVAVSGAFDVFNIEAIVATYTGFVEVAFDSFDFGELLALRGGFLHAILGI